MVVASSGGEKGEEIFCLINTELQFEETKERCEYE